MEGRAQETGAPSPELSQGPMARDKANPCEVDQEKYDADDNVKIICLGDSAVGKSNQPQQLSTYALTLYKHTATVDGKTILVDFWDTAGQERFQSMHASYYHKAHACIMVFDVQRKVTYKNLGTCFPGPCVFNDSSFPRHSHWLEALTPFPVKSPLSGMGLPVTHPANPSLFPWMNRPVSYLLSTADIKVTQKSFNFARKFSLPLYFVSAADGTNVVKLFNDAIRLAVSYKQNSQDFMDEVLQELENIDLEQKEEELPDQEQCGSTKSLPPS
ncbi:rab-like protein 2B isoform X2 [Myotis yumanensis]|uniref:rab-like protein 2B isoform X2 n=1 Tax=Myotis yumanensis TaxID=159337 RepID=UPI0038CFE018